jgi:hypothetical protein
LEDKSPRSNFTFRDYELNIFNCIEEFSSDEEVQSFIKPKSFLAKTIFNIRQKFKPTVIITDSYFDPIFLKKASAIYLDGYFQNEKYFNEIRNILTKEFSLKEQLSGHYKEISHRISGCHSVSIHIRRGDYVSNTITNNYHGICDLNYYNRAMSLMAERITEPHFFIFSDDIGWAKENLKSTWPITFVSGGKNFEDLFLMSQCKHNIIANSSFSWWGAWLNKNFEKIVIGPVKWFNAPKINAEFSLPEKWIRL